MANRQGRMANRQGDLVAHVKRNNELVDVHNGSKYFVLKKNGRVLTGAPWPENTHPNHLWFDIENCDVPKDLRPELLYHRIKRGLEDRNYTGPLTITAIFAKTTEHISLDMLAKLPADIRTVDLGLYNASKQELKDAADNAIKEEIEAFWNNPVNDPARNVMVISGDKIFVETLQDLRGKGYRTLAAFRVSSDEDELNAQVWDSWVFRHLLNLPWTVGDKPREEQDMKRKKSSGSAVLQHYCCVSKGKKLPALVRFLKKSPDQKVVIFFSSCSSVEYHYEMMGALDNDLRCLRIHGNLELGKNLQAFSEFKTHVGGGLVLLCSDAVALGPHIQGVDWIVRFDMPLKLGHYVFNVVHQAHRKEASALLLLDDANILGDSAFTSAFRKVTLKEMKFDKEELTEVQTQVEKRLKKKARNEKLRTLAGEANISIKRRKKI